jgi:hypothetical protein
MPISKEKINKQLDEIGNFYQWFTKKEINSLPEILADDEIIYGITSGTYKGNTWLIVITQKRVVFLNKRILDGSLRQVEFPLKQISSITYDTGYILGSIKFSTSGGKQIIKNIAGGDVPKVARVLSDLIHNDDFNKVQKMNSSDNEKSIKPVNVKKVVFAYVTSAIILCFSGVVGAIIAVSILIVILFFLILSKSITIKNIGYAAFIIIIFIGIFSLTNKDKKFLNENAVPTTIVKKSDIQSLKEQREEVIRKWFTNQDIETRAKRIAFEKAYGMKHAPYLFYPEKIIWITKNKATVYGIEQIDWPGGIKRSRSKYLFTFSGDEYHVEMLTE